MKKKEVLEIIQKSPALTFQDLEAVFLINGKNKRKRLGRILSELLTDHHIEESNGFYQPAARAQKHKEKKPKTEFKPRDRFTKDNGRPRQKDKKLPAVEDFFKVIEEYKIRKDFPPRVMQEALDIEPQIPEEALKNRTDFRQQLVVTIDGADAKDLDDAISIEKTVDGWNLGVHIADVSYYVPKDSRLDREAAKRANSFYFINKVVPMFPKNLSNGICSLNPHEDRLTMSAVMKVDHSGKVVSYQLCESVIHSRHRLTYDWVQQFLDGKTQTDDPELVTALKEMNVLFRVLLNKRIREGAIVFNFKEQKCQLDENDEPLKIWLKERQDSERIIEEFMLLANQTTAKFLSLKGDSLYRIHGEPDPEKMGNFVRMALKMGHQLRGVPVPEPAELQRILEEVKTKPYAEMIQQILLRSMQQARYQTENVGHFGLGFEFYTHFTSPIRRYADLIVHRLIRYHLAKQKTGTLYTLEELDAIGDHISKMERVAMESERDLFKIKAIRFMEGREGRTFPGAVTGVTSFGVFVQITKYGVEGLIRYVDMDDDYYEFDEANYCAVGKRTRHTYTLGDRLTVKVLRVNVARGFLDLTAVLKTSDENPED